MRQRLLMDKRRIRTIAIQTLRREWTHPSAAAPKMAAHSATTAVAIAPTHVTVAMNESVMRGETASVTVVAVVTARPRDHGRLHIRGLDRDREVAVVIVIIGETMADHPRVTIKWGVRSVPDRSREAPHETATPDDVEFHRKCGSQTQL
jgi:hypothetical protein